MKKFLALILALVMTLSLAGCKEDVAIEEVPDDQIPGFTDQTDLEEPVVPISIETDTVPDDSGTPTQPTQPTHTHSYTSKTVAATCTADGYTLHTCSCGDSYKDNTTKKLGHSYKDQVIAPTASAQGYTLHTCTRCGYSYKDNYKPATGGGTTATHSHSYTSKTVAATCTADGYTLHTCSCGDSYKDSTTKKLGHSYKDQVIAPTASAQGYTLHTCTRCGYSYKNNYTDKLSTHTHTWEPIYEEVPVYETVCRTICSTCGADVTGNAVAHGEAHMLNGENGGNYQRYDQVQVGTASQIIGYRCSGCGAEK